MTKIACYAKYNPDCPNKTENTEKVTCHWCKKRLEKEMNKSSVEEYAGEVRSFECFMSHPAKHSFDLLKKVLDSCYWKGSGKEWPMLS